MEATIKLENVTAGRKIVLDLGTNFFKGFMTFKSLADGVQWPLTNIELHISPGKIDEAHVAVTASGLVNTGSTPVQQDGQREEDVAAVNDGITVTIGTNAGLLTVAIQPPARGTGD